jgi:ATP-independent RNA helicase DbpA
MRDISNASGDKNNTFFSSLALHEALLTNLSSLGYDVMTPIQAQSLPSMLSGHDVIAQAQTGSGKTAAFGLTALNQINLKCFAVQALVLCPTRELAEQVSQAIRQFARQLPNVKIINLSGGAPMRPQVDSLRHGAHLVVGTPGRVQKHLDNGSLVLNQLRFLVFDEADRMLDMGFLEAMQSIVKSCPVARQTVLFSATYPDGIKQLAVDFMKQPRDIKVEQLPAEQDIEQRFYEVSPETKSTAFIVLLKKYHALSTLVFCNTKRVTIEVACLLKKEGFSVAALHGDLEQVERDLAVIQFTNQSRAILVATDVAARGLDVQDLPLVVNYELAFERDVHTHRVGRTGRAGKKGLALSLTTPADANRLCALESTQNITWGGLDDFSQANDLPDTPQMVTLCLHAGKKDKLRAADILGALTKDAGLPSNVIGKMNILPQKSYLAVHKSHAKKAHLYFQTGKLKGRRVSVTWMD